MTQNPFQYGVAVSGDFFTDRYREREFLISELSLAHNVILSGPPQYGKSSLARKVMNELEHRGVMTVYVDLERAYSPTRFIEIYLAELLRAAFRQPKDLRAFIQELDPELKKNLPFKLEQNDELILDLDEESNLETIASSVLELAQHTVNYKKRACVVCFDEISRGGNLSEATRKRLLEVAGEHEGVAYLLVSLDDKRHKANKNFMHWGLEKIEARYLKAYIKTRFENTGFRIVESIIDEIFEISEGNSNFTQMICRQLWNQGHTGKVVTNKNLAQAIEGILEVHSEYYTGLWVDLSLHQKNLILAICKGGGQKIFSQDFVGRFGLGSFSTVQKSLNRLLTRQIIDRRGDHYYIRDMFFQRWMTRRII
ncbi:orc1/cdc6 family replication initiation protein [bacterium]|nr:orc1/cdc6 family replication initiation protein [bacterium]